LSQCGFSMSFQLVDEFKHVQIFCRIDVLYFPLYPIIITLTIFQLDINILLNAQWNCWRNHVFCFFFTGSKNHN
jgi:hypothetical protein